MGNPQTLAVVVLATATLFVAPLSGSAGQSSTADTVEIKAKEAGTRAKIAAKDAKAGIKDSWLTAKTKIALFADARVKGRQVKVYTRDGVVRLHGMVDTEDAKSAAGEIARGIEGVKDVQNDLRVVAPSERLAVKVDDAVITDEVKTRLSKDAKLRSADIDVRTSGGVVTVQGEVPSIVDSARASQIAREVPGVRSVKNDLKIRT